jgi:hypothetical protein
MWRAGRAIALSALAALTECAAPPAAGPAPPPPAAPAVVHVAPPRVADLLNDTAEVVIAALGQPVLRHSEGGGEVWLYALANGCSVDLVLLPSGDTRKVAHATTRTPVNMSEAECLRSIASAAP